MRSARAAASLHTVLRCLYRDQKTTCLVDMGHIRHPTATLMSAPKKGGLTKVIFIAVPDSSVVSVFPLVSAFGGGGSYCA